MSVTIKTPEEQEKMRVAGRLAAELLEMIEPHIQPGVTTDEINTIIHEHIVNVQQATPAPLNYRGFPKSVCTSVNHVVCHGIPNDKPLRDGDIINIDVTVIKDGWHGDTSKMYYVGEPSIKARRVVDIAHDAMKLGIDMVKPGVRLGDIGHAIQRHVEGLGCSVVREYCGHGIGQIFHEDPQVLHYGAPGTGMELQTGMTFTI
ncbi:MAG TPA: type I methionyl aminopeptidase, partial [Gammaproteobacteria bacterium]|nr:type I methionyl aminopeptidase [Gammaproteobacteria bacterium]